MRERRLTLIAPGRPLDIVILGVVMALTLVLSIAGSVSDMLTILAFITTFFVPGYMLQAAIFPAGRIYPGNKRVPDFFERIAISLVLSFLVTALTISLMTGGLGIVLLDLSKDMVMSIILMVSALASIVAVDRRLTIPKERAFRVELVYKPGALIGTEKLLAVVIVLLLAVAGINAVFLQGPGGNSTFTTFAIFGLDGDIGSLPEDVVANNVTSFTIFIECKEGHNVQYNLTVWMDNRSMIGLQPIDFESFTALENGTAYFSLIEMADGQRMYRDFNFTISVPGVHRINLHLEVPGELSRDLRLWVNVT